MKQSNNIKVIWQGVSWAVFIIFLGLIGLMSTDSPQASHLNLLIIVGIGIIIPMIVTLALRWRRALRAQMKMFVNFLDFSKFILPFIIGVMLIAILFGIYASAIYFTEGPFDEEAYFLQYCQVLNENDYQQEEICFEKFGPCWGIPEGQCRE